MPLKKKGKGKKKKKGGNAKKKKTVPDGTSAAACKKILRLYLQKSDLTHSVSFRPLTQELSKCVEEDRPLEKVRSTAWSLSCLARDTTSCSYALIWCATSLCVAHSSFA